MSNPDPKFTAFLDAIVAVYQAHGLSIGHEDSEGSFIIEPLTDDNIAWLRDAIDARPEN